VRDVLQQKQLTVNDIGARDFALQPELAAAVAGAGKAVLDNVAPSAAPFYSQVFNSQVRRKERQDLRGPIGRSVMWVDRVERLTDRSICTWLVSVS
jgi:hypothetical protein